MRNREKRRGEAGQILVWVVILLPLLLALTGLVFDGGLLWAQYRRARWAADGAAVAAASEMDWPVFMETGRVVLGANAANTAFHYAQQNDPNLRVTSVYVQDGAVYAQGWTQVEPVFLSMFGATSMRLNVTGKERPAWGASGAGQ